MKLSKEFDLPITISGLMELTTFSLKNEKALAYKKFITQEMLKKKLSCKCTLCLYCTHKRNY